MSKFLIINLTICIFLIFLSKNLFAEVTILPKAQPKIEKLLKKETIIPKNQPKLDKLQKDETSQIELKKPTTSGSTKKKSVLPKNKPIVDDETIMKMQSKKYLLPAKKPESETTEVTQDLKIQENSVDKKIITNS